MTFVSQFSPTFLSASCQAKPIAEPSPRSSLISFGDSGDGPKLLRQGADIGCFLSFVTEEMASLAGHFDTILLGSWIASTS
jgi:hypothetical protein